MAAVFAVVDFARTCRAEAAVLGHARRQRPGRRFLDDRKTLSTVWRDALGREPRNNCRGRQRLGKQLLESIQVFECPLNLDLHAS
jgi:hypothetical protein